MRVYRDGEDITDQLTCPRVPRPVGKATTTLAFGPDFRVGDRVDFHGTPMRVRRVVTHIATDEDLEEWPDARPGDTRITAVELEVV